MLVKALSVAGHIRLAGVMSHFAEAEDEDKSFSEEQASAFRRTVQSLLDAGISPGLLHMANSAAIADYKDAEFNLVRPGLMLYGAYPSERLVKRIDLKPVLALKTRVLSLKNIGTGGGSSPGGTAPWPSFP